MNQTQVSKDASPLFDNAISKLRPRVFSHPVWIRFGNIEESAPHAIVKSLLAEIENLRDETPSDACQVLLLCAVYQQYSGQSTEALETIKAARNLADRNDLEQEIMWALWGASAISVQQRNFQQAIPYLASLIRLLRDQDEWILAGLVDEVMQALQQGETASLPLVSGNLENQPSGRVLTNTFRWLNHWGFSAQTSSLKHVATPSRDMAAQTQSVFSWRSLRLIFSRELKLKWLGSQPRAEKSPFSLGGFFQSLFHVSVPSLDDGSTEVVRTEDRETLEVQSADVPFPAIVANPELTAGRVRSRSSPADALRESFPGISVSVHMLGIFNVTIQETSLNLPTSRSLSLFKYLLLHHKQFTPREVLMEVFWPDSEPETARNNLNVANHSLRRAIRKVIFLPVIVFRDGAYGFEDNVEVWLDIEEFERCVRAGQRLEASNQGTAAIAEYEAAVSLYQGDFLEQNPYEEWTVLERERLRIAYLETLDRLSHIYFRQERYAMCISVCKLILIRDRCREDAHSLLMRCYSRQGQNHLALRQYQVCVEALQMELDVEPAPETTHLYKRIRRREPV
jgi:DNA-binding SARP family transcriptional activator